MPTFKVSGVVSVSCWTEIEAESEAEALDIAHSRPLAEINIDGGNPLDECWHIDNDGSPSKIVIDKERAT